MGIDSVPSSSRAKVYDYCSGAWRSQAAQHSGEVIVAHGETLITAATQLVTSASGGQSLGSGVIERVIVKVPSVRCSGTTNYGQYFNSGQVFGIMLGGKSGNAPYTYNSLSGGGGWCVTSGKGLWLEPGEQKTLYVQNLNEVYVVGEPSGYPVTYVGEVIVC